MGDFDRQLCLKLCKRTSSLLSARTSIAVLPPHLHSGIMPSSAIPRTHLSGESQGRGAPSEASQAEVILAFRRKWLVRLPNAARRTAWVCLVFIGCGSTPFNTEPYFLTEALARPCCITYKAHCHQCKEVEMKQCIIRARKPIDGRRPT